MSNTNLLYGETEVFHKNPVTWKNLFARMLEGEDLKQMMLRGYDEGTLERSDVLVQAADGSDINEIWTEIQQVLSLWNSQRNRLIDYLTFPVDEVISYVGVPVEVDFEEASEYGKPVGIRGGQFYYRGYDFKFYDLAIRYTWMFLAESTRQQIDNYTNMALEADNRLIFKKVMSTIFNSANGVGVADRNIPTTVYKFYNGDGEVPPAYKNITFTGSHTHYYTSFSLPSGINNAALQPQTLDDLENDFYNHGYTLQNGYGLVIWVNRTEGLSIRKFKVANGARYDFIPNGGVGGGVILPASIGIVGRPDGSPIDGSIGTYGPWVVIEEPYIPSNYVVALASGGEQNLNNPVGFREHTNPVYKGLKMVPGPDGSYPLTEGHYRRGFGTGIRQRGGGAIVQMVNNSSTTYTVPAVYNS
jgi:hypothetical protein